jgi:cell division protein FtsL
LIQREYEYVQGNTAKQLEYDVYEENTVLREKRRYKNNRKLKVRMVLSILAVLIAGMTVMYRFAVITQLSYNINQNENKYNELRNENSLLKVQVETQTDLTAIKTTAENRLGMQKPDKSQIVYIKVPRNDYTMVINTQEQARSGEGILKSITGKAAGLLSLFE